VELGTYNPEKLNFPVMLRSTTPNIKVAMNGTLSLQRDSARTFKQEYTSGLVRPQITVKVGGDLLRVVLVNDSDSSIYEYVDSEFITVSEHKLRVAAVAERERRIYTDQETGLMWARCGDIAGKDLDYKDAMSWVANLNHSGYSDWRLPTKEELETFTKRGGNRH
jgi:hypothetical protein